MSFLVLANPELLTPNSNQFIVVDEMAGPEVSFIQRLLYATQCTCTHAETLILKMIVLLGLDA